MLIWVYSYPAISFVLEAGTRVADVPRSFGRYERTNYRLQTCFRQSGSKNDNSPLCRPRITTHLKLGS